MEVIVVPAGTFRLSGVVAEAGAPAELLEDAHVQVTSGGVTLSASSDTNGRYRVFGVAGETAIRVTRDGYHQHTETRTIREHHVLDVPLRPIQPRDQVAGSYRLTITASAECSSTLADDVRRRTYTANVVQNGSWLRVTLSGATFVLLRNSLGNNFGGRLIADAATFSLTRYDWYYKGYGVPYGDIVEEVVAGSAYLVIDGSARVAVTPAGLAGTLDGSFHVFAGDPRWGPRRLARCQARDHGFVFSR